MIHVRCSCDGRPNSNDSMRGLDCKGRQIGMQRAALPATSRGTRIDRLRFRLVQLRRAVLMPDVMC